MNSIFVNDLSVSSTADLKSVKNRIEEELRRRRNLECQHLIDEFQKAWNDLREAGINVTYYKEYDEYITYLNEWDGFNFDFD